MEPTALLASLVTPLTRGATIGVGGRVYALVGLSDEHGLRATFDRVGPAGGRVHVDVDPRDDARPAAVRTAHFALSYRPAQGTLLAPSEGRALCEAVAARVAANEMEALRAVERERGDRTGRVRAVGARVALVRSGEGPDAFDAVSPYVGCLVGCSFCYAQERLQRLRALLGAGEAPWGSWVDAREGLPDLLRTELAGGGPPLPVKLCPIVSDPYQAVEARHRLTRRTLEVLRDDGRRPVLVLTRSALVREDLGLLASMRAWLGFSIPTLDEAVRAALEPRSAPIAERLAILGEARALGIPTFAVVQPVLERDVARLADTLAAACGSVRVDVLRGAYGAEGTLGSPRWAELASDEVQRGLAAALSEALVARGVEVWESELPRALVATDPGPGHLEAMLAPASPALARAAKVLRDAVASGVLDAHLVEPSFALEGASSLRLGINAASARHHAARAATTSALLEALDVPPSLIGLASRTLAEPAHEVFVGISDEDVPRAKLYLRAPHHALREVVRELGLPSLPADAQTVALDVQAGRVVALRSYEPLATRDRRVQELATIAGVVAERAYLARRLDGARAGEEVVHLQVEHIGSLAPATRLLAHVAPHRAPPWSALAARAPLHARVLARSSRGAHTAYLALDTPGGVGSGQTSRRMP